ncbi:hypothetical protein C3L33_00435, partial [Rhododendron williamsianum]
MRWGSTQDTEDKKTVSNCTCMIKGKVVVFGYVTLVDAKGLEKCQKVFSFTRSFTVLDMLKVPAHQVAGHQAIDGKLGPLIDDSGRFYKPLQSDERGANEVAFYTSFFSNKKIPDHIRSHINPSIMDIKIGTRTWPPRASEDYIAKCLKKDRESTSTELGFRISGFQIYGSKESGYWKPDKGYIRSFSAEDVRVILRKFVSSNASADSDSDPDLLMMFEKEFALKGRSSGAEVKLVDFAHVVEGRGVIDHNFLGGLCSFIKFVSEILTGPVESPPKSCLQDSERN